MEERLQDLVARYGRSFKENILHLGYENGWNPRTDELFSELNKRSISGSHTRSGPASSQSLSMKIEEDGVLYTVKWELDSGD